MNKELCANIPNSFWPLFPGQIGEGGEAFTFFNGMDRGEEEAALSAASHNDV